MQGIKGLLLCLCMATATNAELRQLTQLQLRIAVQEGRVLDAATILDSLDQGDGAELLSLRAFEVDGTIVYHLIYRKALGELDTVWVNAQNASEIQPQSELGLLLSSMRLSDAVEAPETAPQD